MNIVYGLDGLIGNPELHDKETEGGNNFIENALQKAGNLTETSYFLNKDNRFELTSSGNDNNKEEFYNQAGIVRTNMRAKTPFNPQSTRGFNIKHFQAREIHKVTVINVPGFEPMHNILMLQLLDKENYNTDNTDNTDAPELYDPNLNIINKNFKTILHSVLKGEDVGASDLKPEKLLEIKKVLTQSCFILQNLNIMGAILTNYLEIRDSKFLKELLESRKSIDKPVNELFNAILKTITKKKNGEKLVVQEPIESILKKKN